MDKSLSLALLCLLLCLSADWLSRALRGHAPVDLARSLAVTCSLLSAAALTGALYAGLPALTQLSAAALIASLIGGLYLALEEPTTQSPPTARADRHGEKAAP